MNIAPETKSRLIRTGIGTPVLLGLLILLPQVAFADPMPPPAPAQESLISPYWHPAVARWESIILEESERRGIDPDLIAAVIWTESLGRPHLHSPAGAVGLMGVMPKEKGFSWRPSAQELEDPALNIFWGTRTLSIIIRQAKGDIYLALAAYNGGWEQIQWSGPRRYAEDTLLHYTRAVAMRMGLPAEGPWVATLAAVDPRVRTGMTVLGPQYPLTRYSARPVVFQLKEAGINGPPTILVFSPPREEDPDGDVGLWLWWNRKVVHPPGSDPAVTRERTIASNR